MSIRPPAALLPGAAVWHNQHGHHTSGGRRDAWDKRSDRRRVSTGHGPVEFVDPALEPAGDGGRCRASVEPYSQSHTGFNVPASTRADQALSALARANGQPAY